MNTNMNTDGKELNFVPSRQNLSHYTMPCDSLAHFLRVRNECQVLIKTTFIIPSKRDAQVRGGVHSVRDPNGLFSRDSTLNDLIQDHWKIFYDIYIP